MLSLDVAQSTNTNAAASVFCYAKKEFTLCHVVSP